MKFSRLGLYVALLIPLHCALHAQSSQPDSTAIQLEEVIVNSLGLQTKYEEYGGSMTIVDRASLTTADPANIVESINRVPGVYMHSGALNTNRITIRGIGSRSPFSTNKIRSYFGEIPLTNGSGETSIEDIDLSSIASYEVIKGPNSSIYGSGLGGVIVLNPLDASQGTIITNDLTVGSFGLVKEQLSFSTQNNLMKVYGSVGHLSSNGYRDNNEVNRSHALLNLRIGQRKNVIDVLTYFVDQKAFIPSSINQTTFEEEPTSAAFTWGAAQGFEDYYTFLQGIALSSIINPKLTLKSSVFLNHRDNYEPRPFNILDEKTTGWGTRTRLIADLSSNTTWLFGTEIFADHHRFQTFQNLYQDFPPGNGSVQGDALSDFKERRNYFNLYTQVEHRLIENLLISAGLNFNQTFYKLEDDFAPDGDDQSGDYDFHGVFSPRLSLNYAVNNSIYLYSAVSHGFSPPTLEETLLPDGTINNDIQPETGLNMEWGARGTWQKLQFDVSLYQMNVRDLLVARRTAEDQFIGINAGKTSHFGLEADLKFEWIRNEFIELTSQNTYAFSDFTFKEFIDGDDDFSGNQLTGVPRHTAFGRVTMKVNPLALYMYVDGQYTSAIPIADDNSLFSDDYLALNGTLGHKLNIGKWSHDLSVTLRNLTDENYASMILINASGFGGSAPRYFYPGLPFNWFFRLRISYQL